MSHPMKRCVLGAMRRKLVGRPATIVAALGGMVAMAIILVAMYVAMPLSTAPSASRHEPVRPASAASEVVPQDLGTPRSSSPSGSPNSGLTEAEAIAVARSFLADDERNAPVWGAESGLFSEIYWDLAHKPADLEQPSDPGIPAGTQAWGIEFKVTIEICGPPSEASTCQVREAIRTVFVDQFSGDWLRTSTYSPASNAPFPTPLP